MRIAAVTCSNLAAWEVDDRRLHAALARRGVEVSQPAWDDPAFDFGACDACLIRTTWDYQERRDAFLDWASRVSRSTRLFNSLNVVRWNTSKTYLRDLERRGVPVIPTIWLDAGTTPTLRQCLDERGWSHAFLKPVIGSTSRETLRFSVDDDGIAAAEQHLHRLLPNESMILQPYLSSVETEGELSVILIDGEVSHAVRKVPVAGDYRVQDDFGATDEPVTLTDADLVPAREVVACVDEDWLYARVDFLRDDDGRLRLSELEMVEPLLFFRHCPAAADRLADALRRRLSENG